MPALTAATTTTTSATTVTIHTDAEANTGRISRSRTHGIVTKIQIELNFLLFEIQRTLLAHGGASYVRHLVYLVMASY